MFYIPSWSNAFMEILYTDDKMNGERWSLKRMRVEVQYVWSIHWARISVECCSKVKNDDKRCIGYWQDETAVAVLASALLPEGRDYGIRRVLIATKLNLVSLPVCWCSIIFNLCVEISITSMLLVVHFYPATWIVTWRIPWTCFAPLFNPLTSLLIVV